MWFYFQCIAEVWKWNVEVKEGIKNGKIERKIVYTDSKIIRKMLELLAVFL